MNHSNIDRVTALCGRLHKAAFEKPRSPRSKAYQDGHLAALRNRLTSASLQTSASFQKCPYPEGTAESDAFWSGWYEGALLAHEHVAEALSS